MTQEEWQRLRQNYETTQLLDAVKHVDALRHQLGEIDGYRPPEIRDKLLKLHQMAMDVVNRGWETELQEMAVLATEIEEETFDILEAAEAINDALCQLTALIPDSVFELDDLDDEDE